MGLRWSVVCVLVIAGWTAGCSGDGSSDAVPPMERSRAAEASAASILASTTGNDTSRFPQQIHGTWDLGPGPCKLPVNPDSDSVIRIKGDLIQGYEDTETPRRVSRISDDPMAWRVEGTESYGGEEVDYTSIFVVNDDSLVMTSGTHAVHYVRCLD